MQAQDVFRQSVRAIILKLGGGDSGMLGVQAGLLSQTCQHSDGVADLGLRPIRQHAPQDGQPQLGCEDALALGRVRVLTVREQKDHAVVFRKLPQGALGQQQMVKASRVSSEWKKDGRLCRVLVSHADLGSAGPEARMLGSAWHGRVRPQIPRRFHCGESLAA